MQLMVNQELHSEIHGMSLKVKKLIGQGGQGEVYLVSGLQGKQAVKWYNAMQATEQQKDALRSLVRSGPPKQGLDRFIWPLDLVAEPSIPGFGYLMPLIDTSRYAELGEVQAHRKPAPDFASICNISWEMALSYRCLHLQGYCYRDLSSGNLMFDPKKGDVLICDNDNVGVDKHSEAQVLGTMEFMAPEVVLGTSKPCTLTDLHSLAVLLFNLWVWHHPMHGQKEYEIRCWDLPAKRRIYGESPVFIFNPKDRSNALPNDVEYTTAQKRWSYCPPSLQKLFTHAFTEGLQNPDKRVTEGEWCKLFLRLKDGAIDCPSCRAGNLWDAEASQLKCWHCHQTIALPPRLQLERGSTLLIRPGTTLLARHFRDTLTGNDASTVVAEVVKNPNNPRAWGLRNHTQTAWKATYANGEIKEVPPQRAAPLNAGVKIQFANSIGIFNT